MISSLSRQLLPRTAAAVASQCSRPAVVAASRPFFSSAPEPEPTIADETSRTFATKKKGPGLKRDAIVDILANEYGLKKAESTRILNTVFDTIVESVTKKETVTIPGFGKFEAVESPPRTYNSPLTGNIPLSKPATTRVKFRPFTHFKECVAEGKVTKK